MEVTKKEEVFYKMIIEIIPRKVVKLLRLSTDTFNYSHLSLPNIFHKNMNEWFTIEHNVASVEFFLFLHIINL